MSLLIELSSIVSGAKFWCWHYKSSATLRNMNSAADEDENRRSIITIQNDEDTKTIETRLLQPDQNDQGDSQFKVYPARFLVVALFSLVQLMTSLLLNTLTPIAAYLTLIYGQSSVVVNLGSLLFALMHPIFTFPAAYAIDTYGTRVGISIGCILCLLGTCLRLLVNESFAWVIVGQVVAGIGRPFILNCQAKISASWFKSDTRGGVTQLLTLVVNISLILGIIVPSLVFSGYKPDKANPQNIQQGKQLTFKLMVIEAILGAICFGLNLAFQQNKPPTPPSDSANMTRDPFNVAMPKMAKNVNYMLLLFSFGAYFGVFNAISIILSFLLAPWFGSDKDLPMAVAAVGGSPIISGILGVLIIGAIQRKSGTFKKWILLCMAGSSVALCLFYPMLETYSVWLVAFISMFNSFFLIPLVPIMLELGCELVFPVGEGSAAGLLFAMGNFGGFLLGLILSSIVKGQTKMQTVWGLVFCVAVFIVGIILTIIMKEEKNRQMAESEASSKRRTTSSNSSSQNNSLGEENKDKDEEARRKAGENGANILSANPAQQDNLNTRLLVGERKKSEEQENNQL